ncbi:MAG: MATE family efflux transporter [Fusobacterium sp. JB019]|nr:MATE family efflux transporter [Fusobacterium sp. JB019]
MKLDLGKDSLTKIIFKYGYPSVITMWIFSLYTIVDGTFIGRYLGAKEIAAVNIVMPYVNLSFALGIMIAIGSSTIIAINLGEGNKEKANKIYSLSLELLFLFGSLLGILGILFPKKIVAFLGANDIILNDAATYLFYLSFFTLFYLLSYGFEVFVRIEGCPSYSMICLCIGAALNIILDYYFILHLNLGIQGAALATGIAQFGTALSLFMYLVFKSKKLKFSPIKLSFINSITICYKGLSEFVTEIATGIVIMAFNIVIMRIMGEKGVSAFGIIGYISTLVTMTMIGFSQGIQPVISYNYGALNFKRIKNILKIELVTVLILGALFYIFINTYVGNIISIFITDDKTIYNITKKAINIYSFTYLLVGINIIISAFFTAIENSFVSSILSTIRGFIIINLLLYTFPSFFHESGIWLSAPTNEFLTLIISISIFINIGLKSINKKYI